MADLHYKNHKSRTWKSVFLRILVICAGAVIILLPAWLPNSPQGALRRGSVELMQASLLAGSAIVILGALAHAGYNRPVCRVLAYSLCAALVGELEDFISGILSWPFPDIFIISILLSAAIFTGLRHKIVMLRFFENIGHHAGAGFIGSALLIIYVFNLIIGADPFWQISLGEAFSPEIPKICKSYLELLACYLIFIGTSGLAITLARRNDP